jgi:hypothetical protein
MYWHDCNKEPPANNIECEVLVLDYDIYRGTRWLQTSARYDSKNGNWDLWLDGFGWSSDSGYVPLYWIELPPFPPLPYDGPMCEYFSANQCMAQKNMPRCYCQGNKEKCEK